MTIRPIALLFLLAAAAHADEPDIQRLLKDNNVPAAGIGIIEGGTLRQIRIYGELRKGVPAPYDTIFNVASLTKPVVTMLTLKLVSMGQWQLDEPLSRYWIDPDVAADPRHKVLTTRHVLNHQTGFANWRWMETSKKLTFQFDPGTRFQYSGEGFEYLRKALERKFKKPLAELSRIHLFSPLGMTDTQHAWNDRTDESRFARWHDQNGNLIAADYKTGANAADDLLTTVEDYGRFAVWVVNGAGLPAALFNDMIEPRGKMGLGWEIQKDLKGAEYALIHSGSDKGVHALIILTPKSKQGLVVLTNGDNGWKLFGPLVSEWLDAGKELLERAR